MVRVRLEIINGLRQPLLLLSCCSFIVLIIVAVIPVIPVIAVMITKFVSLAFMPMNISVRYDG